MLDAIGEDPVSSLESGLPDADNAIRFLDRVTQKVLAAGWHVNRDEDVTLAADENGEIPVPEAALRIDTTGTDCDVDVVARTKPGTSNRFLWDRGEQTFTIGRSLQVDVVKLLDFDELTPELAIYIAARATLEFQDGEITSVALAQLLTDEKNDAWAALQDAEAETEDSNVLRQSPHSRYIAYRNSYMRR